MHGPIHPTLFGGRGSRNCKPELNSIEHPIIFSFLGLVGFFQYSFPEWLFYFLTYLVPSGPLHLSRLFRLLLAEAQMPSLKGNKWAVKRGLLEDDSCKLAMFVSSWNLGCGNGDKKI